jgi:putative transposase
VHYRFWQRGGGYDRNVFEPATVFQQIEYMHNNPVRRGLCAKPEDWLWSGAAEYAGVRVGPLRLDRESLPVLGASEGTRPPCPRLCVGMPSPARSHAHAGQWAWHPTASVPWLY